MQARSLITASAVAALLAGCSGAANPPAAVSGALPANVHSVAGSWMAADAPAGSLLYVSDSNNNDVDVYSYPAAKLKGKLTGFSVPHGMCVDPAGDVFITSGGSSEIFEYAHGGTKPIRTLQDPGYFPKACSVDPTTGNLAVMNFQQTAASGNVVIYAHAKGKPKAYEAPNMFFYYFVDYDAQGNLFMDGDEMDGRTFVFAKMPAGGTGFADIAVDHAFFAPGAVQWIGKTLLIGDQQSLIGPSGIFEFSVKGNKATQTGDIQLTNSCDVLGTWIDGSRIIEANACTPTVQYFNYPAGGHSKKTISGSLGEPIGVAVSLK